MPQTAEFRKFIRCEPVGTVLVIAPRDYPYLTAINSIVPALLAGNTVILKHASQTLLCVERLFVAAAVRIGEQIDTGTIYMNRCDYVDPLLVLTGIKDTGRGIALSQLGFDSYTRLKSFHLKQ